MKTIYDERAFDRLTSRLARLRPESAGAWGRMTAHGAVCHL